MIDLQDKLYTSSQVAEILGVSLRTLYRYMEDNKIASMRTASGRHRFTKQHILDFLNAGDEIGQMARQTPQTQPASQPAWPSAPLHSAQSEQIPPQTQTPPQPEVQMPSESVQEPSRQVQVDDPSSLPSFPQPQPVAEAKEEVRPVGTSIWEREPKADFQPQRQPQPQSEFQPSAQVQSPVQPQVQPQPQSFPTSESVDLSIPNLRYYKSSYTDLIELAKKIKEIAASKDLEYAFTLYAGLSLHFLIKPFTILHFYGNPEDVSIWKEELKLVPSNKKEEANIGILINTDIVFVATKEIGGFRVVEDKILLKDLSEHKEEELFKKLRESLTS